MDNPLSYLTRRVKGSASILSLRKEIILERKDKCEHCGTENGRKDLDHIIPVVMLGKVFDKQNLQLLCMRCHKKKTKVDLLIIQTVKKLKYLSGSNTGYTLYISPEELQAFYISESQRHKRAIKLCEDWWNSNTHSIPYKENIL